MTEGSRSDRYSPDRKGLMLKYGSIAGAGIIAGGSMFALSACSNRRDQWAETSGKAGQINMEAVEEAMKDSNNVSEFETRVNEIYQGEEMVLIEVKNQGNEQHVSGYADLNDNSQIDNEDEKLFTFRRWYENDRPMYSMRGHGVNSYYHHPYPPGTSLLTTYLLVSALTRPMYMAPGYYYSTVPRNVTIIRNHRTDYRQKPSYRNQIDTNSRYQTRMSAKHGTTYRKASPSATRAKWAKSKGVNLNKATRMSKSGTSRSFKGSGSTSSRGWGGLKGAVSGSFRGGTAGGGIGSLEGWSLDKQWAATERP